MTPKPKESRYRPTCQTLTPTSDRAFAFLPINRRPSKPRTRGVTEIRGPYYTPMGKRYLADVLETMGSLRRFAEVRRRVVHAHAAASRRADLIELCHEHDVLVSTGGFIEHVLTQGPEAVAATSTDAKSWASTSSRFQPASSPFPATTGCGWSKHVQKAGLKAKPEVGIQFGAGGATAAAELEAEGTRDPEWAIAQARRFLDAGAYMIMIESEGITENVPTWRTDVIAKIGNALGLERVMFEAADPEVFGWYVKNYGAEVNLFVDHSQIVQLECLRSGIWGTKSLWGRVVTYKG